MEEACTGRFGLSRQRRLERWRPNRPACPQRPTAGPDRRSRRNSATVSTPFILLWMAQYQVQLGVFPEVLHHAYLCACMHVVSCLTLSRISSLCIIKAWGGVHCVLHTCMQVLFHFCTFFISQQHFYTPQQHSTTQYNTVQHSADYQILQSVVVT